ncbi:MAG: YggS family pyridoxal phosphate-dependent enzyme [Xanthomonadaceae bacterium]|nr:YggS family pyridoxal phosphate-dependent enzyme [Xanthomonadaceae bacterium]
MNVGANLEAVRGRIRAAARAVGREPDDIALLAVSKAQPLAALQAAWAAGQRAFGENYIQEADAHIDALPDAEWHYIGRIQANKARAIAERFAWVHTVDRTRIAERMSTLRPSSLPPLNVCIQVNLDNEASKSGTDAAGAAELAAAISALPRLRLRGLMALPRATADADLQRAAFATVRQLFEALQERHRELDTLSLGMSGDMEAAIAEGATIVRIGTGIFGARA